MTRRSAFIFVAFSFLVFVSTLAFARQPVERFKVIWVTDGDTVKVIDHDRKLRIRLVGIDAPETRHGWNKPGQPYGKRSTRYLIRLLLHRTVEVKEFGYGPYHRLLGEIFLNGQDINLRMVKAGLAEVYRGRPARGLNLAPYLKAEREARKAKLGMWALGRNYISPKRWRRMHR